MRFLARVALLDTPGFGGGFFLALLGSFLEAESGDVDGEVGSGPTLKELVKTGRSGSDVVGFLVEAEDSGTADFHFFKAVLDGSSSDSALNELAKADGSGIANRFFGEAALEESCLDSEVNALA